MKKLLFSSACILICLFAVTNGFAQITFSADFENASLQKAELVGMDNITSNGQSDVTVYKYEIEAKVDPVNPVDTSLAPSSRWFHFLIKNCNGQTINLKFTNSDPTGAVYSYDGVNYIRFNEEERVGRFNVQKQFENDSVYVAYYVPYTYSKLMKRVHEWNRNECVLLSSIGQSTRGLEMPLLIITDGIKGISNKYNAGSSEITEQLLKKACKGKKIVYIHGRVHPSESPASWNLDGIIDGITADSRMAKELREKAVFFILPFTNPDGVAGGCSRSNMEGINLEINWARGNDQTAVEVKNMKRFLNSLLSKHRIDLVLNMHSQIDNSATFWVHSAESTSDECFRKLMLICSTTTSGNPYFNNDELSYSGCAERYMEGWFWNQFKERTPAITFETPYGYYHHDSTGVWVTTDNLRKMGMENNLASIMDYLQISTSDRVLLPAPSSKKGLKAIRTDRYVTFTGKVMATKENATKAEASYKIKNLKPGSYNVYMWVPGKVNDKDEAGTNRWELVDSITNTSNGKFVYKYELKDMSENPDALLLIRK